MTTREKPINTNQVLELLVGELSAQRKERETARETPRSDSQISQALQALPEKFALFQQAQQLHSETRNKQLESIEKTLAADHDKVKGQFDSVNQNLTALMMADGKLRSDLEQFVLKHDAPKLIVRLETVEAKVAVIEKRNATQDGAALTLKFAIGLLGFIAGLAVKYL